MVEGVIPQAHLQKESVYFFIYTNFNTFIELTPGLKEMSENKLKTEEELSQSILYKIRHFFSSRQKLKDENSKVISDLCSHGDVGYRGDASAGLWLFVLGSGLFKHLLPLTKRHNTPAEMQTIKH